MRSLCAFATIATLFATSNAHAQSGRRAAPKPVGPGFAVVELFTSQGCSSCPSADKVLKSVAQAADEKQLPVYALSMHVDYWNYLGWEDPYSSKQFTNRQRAYARAAQSSRIYTPQMVVNGQTEFVGSNAGTASQAVKQALGKGATAQVRLNVTADDTGNAWQVQYQTAGSRPGDYLVACLVADAAANDVDAGENRGESLAHVGVVRTLATRPLDRQPNGAVALKWPKDQTLGETKPSIVAFVQNAKNLEIRGATRWAP